MMHRPLLSKYSLESPYELLCLGQSECQWWQQTYHIRAAYACEHVLLEEQPVADLLDRFLKFNTNHKTASAHLLYTLNPAQLIHQVIAYFVDILKQHLLFHHFKHGLCCGAQVV